MAKALVIVLLSFSSVCLAVDLLYQVQEEESNDVYLGNLGTYLRNKNLVTDEQLQGMNFNILNVDETYVSKFMLAENSGDLSALAKIDREAICESRPSCVLQLRIGAKSGTIFITMNVNISVNDINDNKPEFGKTSIQLPILERSPVNSTFPVTSANDADASGSNNSQVTYELIPDTGIFGLHLELNQQGKTDVSIFLKQTVDRERQSFYQLYLVAKDGGRPQQTSTLSVEIPILDYNDNKPVFEKDSYSATVAEDVTVGEVIVKVNATDEDAGDNGAIRYHISDSSPTNSKSFFQIDAQSGDISTVKALSYPEGGEPFTLFVKAEDSGIPQLTSETVVKIYIIDINNHAPEIKINTLSTSNTASVKENSKVGTIVAYVAVVDKDSSVNGQVTCSISSALFGLEVIPDSNDKEFKVVTSMILNRESSIEHVVTIECEDKGTPKQTNSISFIIQVQDVNDNPPVFSQQVYYANISENNDVDSVILRIMASDADQGLNANIQFSVEESKANEFGVDNQGFIKTKVVFDREIQDRVTFKVLATDGGTPSLTANATVVVNIMDENDKNPNFTSPHFQFQILENSPADVPIGKLTAYDDDIGSNGEIMFSLRKPLQLNLPFLIHPDGTIMVTRVLNREDKELYNFKVMAEDRGVPVKNSTADVTIQVLDENDNFPVIVEPIQNNGSISVSHLTPQGSEVAHVEAYDLDKGLNGSLVYYLSNADQDLFFMEESSGKIYLGRKIDTSDIKEYTLFIVVSDKGQQPKQSTTSIRLKVEYSTVANKMDGVIGQNVLIAISIACVTIVLSLVIIVTIFLIRRMDKKKFSDSGFSYEEVKPNENTSKTNNGATPMVKITNLHDRKNNNVQNKKEVSFSVDETRDSGVFMIANDHSSPLPACRNPHLQNNVTSHKYSSHGLGENAFMHFDHSRVDEPFSEGSYTELHREASIRLHQSLLHSIHKNNHDHHEEVQHFLYLKKNMEDTRSDGSGDVTVTDSGRGGSDEDMHHMHPSIMI